MLQELGFAGSQLAEAIVESHYAPAYAQAWFTATPVALRDLASRLLLLLENMSAEYQRALPLTDQEGVMVAAAAEQEETISLT